MQVSNFVQERYIIYLIQSIIRSAAADFVQCGNSCLPRKWMLTLNKRLPTLILFALGCCKVPSSSLYTCVVFVSGRLFGEPSSISRISSPTGHSLDFSGVCGGAAAPNLFRKPSGNHVGACTRLRVMVTRTLRRRMTMMIKADALTMIHMLWVGSVSSTLVAGKNNENYSVVPL